MAQQNKHGAQTKGGAMGFVENGSMGCFKSLYECAAQIRKDFEKRHLDFCKDPFPEKNKTVACVRTAAKFRFDPRAGRILAIFLDPIREGRRFFTKNNVKSR